MVRAYFGYVKLHILALTMFPTLESQVQEKIKLGFANEWGKKWKKWGLLPKKSIFGHYSDFMLSWAIIGLAGWLIWCPFCCWSLPLLIERLPNLFDFHINLSTQVRNPDRSSRALCDSLECCNFEDGNCQASPLQNTCTGDYIWYHLVNKDTLQEKAHMSHIFLSLLTSFFVQTSLAARRALL